MDQDIEEFKIPVRSRIDEFSPNCIYNTDQSGFEYEMRPGRTLHPTGAHTVPQLHDTFLHCDDDGFSRWQKIPPSIFHNSAGERGDIRAAGWAEHVQGWQPPHHCIKLWKDDQGAVSGLLQNSSLSSCRLSMYPPGR